MFKTLAILTVTTGAWIANAQARPTATRLADAQIGGSYINGNSDYARSRFNGYGIYGDFDFRGGFGVEGEYHFMSDRDNLTNVYERTYEIGGRYSRHYGRFQPYAKVLVGRGVFNYPFNVWNLAYNIGALGGGTDVRILRHVNARVDFESQRWFSFSRNGNPLLKNDNLSPSLLSAGVAYHF